MPVSVDLPMPGEPPSSTSDPGTRPPPSTRSSSPMPVESRGARSRADVAQRARARAAADGPARARPPAPPARAARRALLDERVPRPAARGTGPCQRGLGVAAGGADVVVVGTGHRGQPG